jgi:hypothetical protein
VVLTISSVSTIWIAFAFHSHSTRQPDGQAVLPGGLSRAAPNQFAPVGETRRIIAVSTFSQESLLKSDAKVWQAGECGRLILLAPLQYSQFCRPVDECATEAVYIRVTRANLSLDFRDLAAAASDSGSRFVTLGGDLLECTPIAFQLGFLAA